MHTGKVKEILVSCLDQTTQKSIRNIYRHIVGSYKKYDRKVLWGRAWCRAKIEEELNFGFAIVYVTSKPWMTLLR